MYYSCNSDDNLGNESIIKVEENDKFNDNTLGKMKKEVITKSINNLSPISNRSLINDENIKDSLIQTLNDKNKIQNEYSSEIEEIDSCISEFPKENMYKNNQHDININISKSKIKFDQNINNVNSINLNN